MRAGSFSISGGSFCPFLFFGFLFFYLLLSGAPQIIYTFNGIGKYSFILESTREFFLNILAVPGGHTKLAVTYLIYACHYPILGALLLTLTGWGFYAGFKTYGEHCRGTAPLTSLYLPGLFLLFIVGRYNMQYFIPVIAILGMLFLAVLYQRIPSSNALLRCLTFSALFILSYYFFSMTCLVFAVLIFIHEIFSNKKMPVPLAGVLSAAVLAIFAIQYFFFPFDMIFRYGDILDLKKPVFYLCLYFPLVTVIFGLAAFRFARPDAVKRPASSSFFRRLEECVIVLLLIAAIEWNIHDKTSVNIREIGQTVYLTQNGMWRQILEKRNSPLFKDFPREFSSTLLLLSNAFYRALFHTGRLGSDMFSFPQIAETEPLLLCNYSMTPHFPAWAMDLDLSMDLGMVNLAEKIAGEAMENMGPHEFLLYRRSLIQIARGNRELAAVYLTKLKHMPAYGKKAALLLQDLDDDAKLTSFRVIEHLRACMDRDDYVWSRASTVSEEKMLLNLLSANPHNKMAFEYLMAYYLLTRQPQKIAQNMFRLTDFDYSEIPIHYQEALLLYLHSDTSATVNLAMEIPKSAYERFRQFSEEYNLFERNEPGARNRLLSDFGGSYLFFYMFGYAPGGTR